MNDDIVAIAALWGMLLSTALAGKEYLKNRPRIRVKMRDNMIVSDMIPGGEKDRDQIAITVMNRGLIPSTLSSLTIHVKGADWAWWIKADSLRFGDILPVELTPGKRWTRWFSAEDLAAVCLENDQMKKVHVRAEVSDQADRTYNSRYMQFYPADHLISDDTSNPITEDSDVRTS